MPAAATSRPPLTTVRQPHREKGRLAAELLLAPRADHAPRVLPTELVVRGSTAPPSRDP